MRIAIPIVLVLCGGSAHGATLYKCVAPSRHVTYQSEPCPKDWPAALAGMRSVPCAQP
jgi:hypothetical protein